jgi:hypothetical protein
MDDAVNLQIIPVPPPGLNVILENFKNTQVETQEGINLLGYILQSKKRYGEGFIPDDVNIRNSIQMNASSEKWVYQEAYINYMGLTFHFNDARKYDAAWFYYARAQHCLGLCDTWDKILDHLIHQDQERQNRAKGGRQKNHKHTMPLIDAFIRVANEQRPSNGWKNKKELIEAAMPMLAAIVDKNGPDSFPLHENLERTAYRWLKNGTDAYLAYMENIAPSNDDSLS